MERHERVRWYNPAIEDFEWREIPKSDEEALSLLEGSPHTSICKQTYTEWRTLQRIAEMLASPLRFAELPACRAPCLTVGFVSHVLVPECMPSRVHRATRFKFIATRCKRRTGA